MKHLTLKTRLHVRADEKLLTILRHHNFLKELQEISAQGESLVSHSQCLCAECRWRRRTKAKAFNQSFNICLLIDCFRWSWERSAAEKQGEANFRHTSPSNYSWWCRWVWSATHEKVQIANFESISLNMSSVKPAVGLKSIQIPWTFRTTTDICIFFVNILLFSRICTLQI